MKFIVGKEPYNYDIHHYVDINGKPVKHRPRDYPYSYDNFVLWKGDNFKETTNCIVSFQLSHINHEKYTASCIRAWERTGDNFGYRSPEDLEQFLCYFYGISLDLTAVVQGCKNNHGYPYWVFYFKRNEPFKVNNPLTEEDYAALAKEKEIFEAIMESTACLFRHTKAASDTN